MIFMILVFRLGFGFGLTLLYTMLYLSFLFYCIWAANSLSWTYIERFGF